MRKFCRYYDIIIENKTPAVSLPVTVNNSAIKSDSLNISQGHETYFKSYAKGDEMNSSIGKSPIKSTVRILNSSERSGIRVVEPSE